MKVWSLMFTLVVEDRISESTHSISIGILNWGMEFSIYGVVKVTDGVHHRDPIVQS